MPDVVCSQRIPREPPLTLYQEPGLCALELWHGIARGVPLFRVRENKAEYFEALRDFLIGLHRGEATTADARDTPALKKAMGFRSVVLCGGEALHALLKSASDRQKLPFTVEIDDSGPYAGKRGVLRIFHEMRWRRGAALDLGQIQMKVMTADGDSCLPRDLALLPLDAGAVDQAAARERIRAFIRKGLSLARQADGIVLGLPAAIDSRGMAQPSSYPGLSGSVEHLFSGVFSTPWVVINDAVLAALGFPPRHGEKTLVVTLGFGVGGALWER